MSSLVSKKSQLARLLRLQILMLKLSCSLWAGTPYALSLVVVQPLSPLVAPCDSHVQL